MNGNEILQMRETVNAPLQCQAYPPHRILVVDDEPLMRQLNIKMLVDAGYDVDAAADGADAWNTLQQKNFDLLITDHSMPKVSGVELIQKVRTAGMALPVIMATAALPHEEFTRAPQLKPTATLLKPYTLAEFLGTVQSVLCGVLMVILQFCLPTEIHAREAKQSQDNPLRNHQCYSSILCHTYENIS